MQYSKEVEMHSTGDVFLSQFVTAIRKPSQKTLTFAKAFQGFSFLLDLLIVILHDTPNRGKYRLVMTYRYDLAIVANLIIIKRLGISKLS